MGEGFTYRSNLRSVQAWHELNMLTLCSTIEWNSLALVYG